MRQLRRLIELLGELPRLLLLGQRMDDVLLALGGSQARAVRAATFESISDAEFRIFSQWGQDGIIQYLLGKVQMEQETFLELGTDDYYESNTRFLLQHDNWRGVIINGGRSHLKFIKRRGLVWRHDITAISAWVTRENVRELLSRTGLSGEIGLLSLDIDGNDYWILQELLSSLRPRILLAEYNATFGARHAISVPYDPGFDRTTAHFSWLYYGASLRAMASLAERFGYRLVGCASTGNDAFFVRADQLGTLRALSVEEAYRPSRFREAHDRRGRLAPVGPMEDRLRLIAEMPVVDVATGERHVLGALR